MKLNPKALGLSLGLVWGVGIAILVLLSKMIPAWLDGVTALVDFMGKLYIGFDMSFVGTLIGALWGFVDAFIGGYVIAWVYNKFA